MGVPKVRIYPVQQQLQQQHAALRQSRSCPTLPVATAAEQTLRGSASSAGSSSASTLHAFFMKPQPQPATTSMLPPPNLPAVPMSAQMPLTAESDAQTTARAMTEQAGHDQHQHQQAPAQTQTASSGEAPSSGPGEAEKTETQAPSTPTSTAGARASSC